MTLQLNSPSRPGRARATLRGLAAVLTHLLGALDALVTARLGIPPLAWLARRTGHAIADEYRRGYAGAVDAEVIDEDEH